MSQQTTSRPKLVLFDMDNVLCHYSRTKRLRYLARATGLTVTDIEESIFGSGFDLKGDMGHYSTEEYFEGFCDRLDKKATIKDWIEARRISILPDNDMLDLVRTLKQSSQVALLTNNGPALHQVIEDLFPAILEIFGDNVFFSYQFKTAKPDTEIFLKVANLLSFKPSEILFVDDLSENTDGALAAGMQEHHFQGINGFQQKLSDLGLI